MKCYWRILIISVTLFTFIYPATAQKIVIKGKVTDAITGEPITFANIAVRGTSISTNSNFDGLYKLSCTTGLLKLQLMVK